MASIDRKAIEPVLAQMLLGDAVSGFDPTDYDLSLEVEIQTDKDSVKLLPCRECKRPLAVTTFFAPAKAICRSCKGDSPDAGIASVGVPIPGQTDPAKARNLADTLVNKTFAVARCPVHPDDESHEMVLIHVVHNDNYGPGEWILKKGDYVWQQTAPGESVRHQCQKCLATVDYSTTHVVKFRRQNEPRTAPNLGPPHRNSMVGFHGPDPTAHRAEEVAA